MKESKAFPLLLLAVILAAVVPVSGQSFKNEDFHDMDFAESKKGRIFLIPEAGLMFGPYTNIELAPQFGYNISDRLSIGIGPHYMFYQNRDFYSPLNFSSHIWGVKAFTRLTLIQNAADFLPFYLFDDLFAHFEYELMTLENQYFNAPSFPADGRFISEYIYVGGGIVQNMGPNASTFIEFLWNMNQSFNSLHRNPTYRVGLIVYL